MNTFYRKTLALCFFLIVMFVTVGTATADDIIEIRGPVYDGSDLTDILTNTAYGSGSSITMDSTQLAVFYYDIDNDVTTETLQITPLQNTQK
jgi:hypothetical protein